MKKYLTWRKNGEGWTVTFVTEMEDESSSYQPTFSAGDEESNRAVLRRFAPEIIATQVIGAGTILLKGLLKKFADSLPARQ